MNENSRRLALLTLGGVFTSPDFMDEFREEMRRRCERAGWCATAHSVMPYGDWTLPRIRQAAEVTVDVLFPAFGGRRAASEAARLREPSREGAVEVALLGHSGGGVAAVHAAAALARTGIPVRAVAMIGSPKTPVPQSLRTRTAAWSLADARGRIGDPVARLGSWLGRPPAHTARLALIGGHRDYFRSRSPFVNEAGESNLSVTSEAVWRWLRELEPAGGKE